MALAIFNTSKITDIKKYLVSTIITALSIQLLLKQIYTTHPFRDFKLIHFRYCT